MTNKMTKFVKVGIIFTTSLLGLSIHAQIPGPTNYDQANAIEDQLCTNSVSSARSLKNSDECRRSFRMFIARHQPVPDAVTMEFREFKVGLIQAICNTKFVEDGSKQHPIDITKKCFEDGVKEFAKNIMFYELSEDCTFYGIQDKLLCDRNLLESVRRSTDTEIQIYNIMKTRQNLNVEALTADSQDGPNYRQLNDLIDRVCTRTIKTRFELTNGDLCRKISLDFVSKYVVPRSGTLEFKRYRAGLSQALCTANYTDDREDTGELTKSMCWAAALDQLDIKNKCDEEDIECMSNLMASVKANFESQIFAQHLITHKE